MFRSFVCFAVVTVGLPAAIASASEAGSISPPRPVSRQELEIDRPEANSFASKVEIKSATAKVRETRRVRTGVRGIIMPGTRRGTQILVSRGGEVYTEFPETYRVSVRVLAPFEHESAIARVTLIGGGQASQERVVQFGAVASKVLDFDFAASEVTAPNRITVDIVGGQQSTFAIDVPHWGEAVD